MYLFYSIYKALIYATVIIAIFTRGQFWPSGIVVACVCLCVRLCVR